MKKLVALALTSVFATSAFAFPAKPITLVVPFPPGPTDTVTRQLAEAMRKAMPGATFVVENTSGAGGTIGANRVARADADGHTLLVWHIGMASTANLYRKLPFKALEDFEYLGMINEVPMTLVGSPKLPANTYKEFEAYVRANGGKLNLAHAGIGAASHLCGLMWQSAMGLKEGMTTIPFTGTGPALSALIGGQVDLMCDQTTNTSGQIEAKSVKAFAVTTTKRLSDNALLKDLPTLQESGLKGFDLTIWHGLYAPKGTPAAVTKQLNTVLQAALKDPEFIAKQKALGAVVVTDKRVTNVGHKAFVADQIKKLGPVIDAAGQFAD